MINDLSFKQLMQLILTFLPVHGVIVTFILSTLFSGLKRWLVLLLVPCATFLLFLALREFIIGNGNTFAAITYGFYVVGLIFYYPVLIIFAVVLWLKDRKRVSKFNMPIPQPPRQ